MLLLLWLLRSTVGPVYPLPLIARNICPSFLGDNVTLRLYFMPNITSFSGRIIIKAFIRFYIKAWVVNTTPLPHPSQPKTATRI